MAQLTHGSASSPKHRQSDRESIPSLLAWEETNGELYSVEQAGQIPHLLLK